MREPNFISPMRWPVLQHVARAAPGSPPGARPGRRSGGRPRGAPRPSTRVAQGDLAALVLGRALEPVGRVPLAGAVGDLLHAAGVRRAVDVHVEERQEDADLLPVARPGRRRPGPARRTSPCRRRVRGPGPVRACRWSGVRSGSRKKAVTPSGSEAARRLSAGARLSAATAAGTALTATAEAAARSTAREMRGHGGTALDDGTFMLRPPAWRLGASVRMANTCSNHPSTLQGSHPWLISWSSGARASTTSRTSRSTCPATP